MAWRQIKAIESSQSKSYRNISLHYSSEPGNLFTLSEGLVTKIPGCRFFISPSSPNPAKFTLSFGNPKNWWNKTCDLSFILLFLLPFFDEWSRKEHSWDTCWQTQLDWETLPFIKSSFWTNNLLPLSCSGRLICCLSLSLTRSKVEKNRLFLNS